MGKVIYLDKVYFVLFFFISTLGFFFNNKTIHISFIISYISLLFLFNLIKLNEYNIKKFVIYIFERINEKKFIFLIIMIINIYVINEYFLQNEKLILFFTIYSLPFLIFFFSENIKFKSGDIMKLIFCIYFFSLFLDLILLEKNLKLFIKPEFFFYGPFLNKNISALILVFLYMANNGSKNIDLILLILFVIIFKSAIAVLILFLYLFYEKFHLPIIYKFIFLIFCFWVIVYIFPREADIDRINNYFDGFLLILDYFSLGLGSSGSIGSRIIGSASIGLESSVFYFINEFALMSIFFLFYEYFQYSRMKFFKYFIISAFISGIIFSPFFYITYIFILKFYYDRVLD